MGGGGVKTLEPLAKQKHIKITSKEKRKKIVFSLIDRIEKYLAQTFREVEEMKQKDTNGPRYINGNGNNTLDLSF